MIITILTGCLDIHICKSTLIPDNGLIIIRDHALERKEVYIKEQGIGNQLPVMVCDD